MGTGRIVSNPAVMQGKPVVEGTRITVEAILEHLAAGETEDQLLAAWPRVTRDDLRAALGYAAEAMKAETSYAVREVAA